MCHDQPFKNVRRPFVKVVWLLLFCAVLLVAACEKKKPLGVGDLFPVLTVVDLNGKTVKIKDFNGKVSVIQFWQDACCGDQLPILEAVYKKYKDQGLRVMGINLRDSQEKVKRVVRALKLSFPNVRDPLLIVSKRCQVYGLPTYFIVGPKGVIREKILGNVPQPHLEKRVVRLLEGT